MVFLVGGFEEIEFHFLCKKINENIINKTKKSWWIIFIGLAIAISVGFPEVLLFRKWETNTKAFRLWILTRKSIIWLLCEKLMTGRYVLSNTYSIPKNIPFLYPERRRNDTVLPVE